jgi:hypothetical protein
MMANDELQLEADTKGKSLKTPTTVNKASGKVSTSAYAFSDQNWGEVARKLTTAAGRCTEHKLCSIMETVRLFALKDGSNVDTDESEDEYTLICKS